MQNIIHRTNYIFFCREFEPFASSPPAPEDSFFYIRYPKPEKLFDNTKVEQDVPRFLPDSKNLLAAAAQFNVKEKDWSKHTKPCQDVLHGIANINTAGTHLLILDLYINFFLETCGLSAKNFEPSSILSLKCIIFKRFQFKLIRTF